MNNTCTEYDARNRTEGQPGAETFPSGAIFYTNHFQVLGAGGKGKLAPGQGLGTAAIE